MATSPDLPPPVTPHPPDVPELPVEPDQGPATPPGNLAESSGLHTALQK